jgi:hypothetical protein
MRFFYFRFSLIDQIDPGVSKLYAILANLTVMNSLLREIEELVLWE